MVAAFLVLKKYEIIRPLIPASLWDLKVETIGLSYLLFRQIHFLVDVSQEQIPAFSFCKYLNYQCNLFGFLSGPIQGYQEFDERWSNLRPLLQTRHELLRAYLRLFVGLIKIPLSTYMLQRYTLDRSWFADLCRLPMWAAGRRCFISAGFFMGIRSISISISQAIATS